MIVMLMLIMSGVEQRRQLDKLTAIDWGEQNRCQQGKSTVSQALSAPASLVVDYLPTPQAIGAINGVRWECSHNLILPIVIVKDMAKTKTRQVCATYKCHWKQCWWALKSSTQVELSSSEKWRQVEVENKCDTGVGGNMFDKRWSC